MNPPPVCTLPVEVIAIPLGLIRYTDPFAVICPAMVEVVPPVTRLSVADCASGWRKMTLLPAATSKLVQLTIAFALA